LCRFFGGKLVYQMGVSGGYFSLFCQKFTVFAQIFGVFIEFGLKNPKNYGTLA
jgi:hypothetical protein